MSSPTSRAQVGRGVIWTLLDSGTTQILATAVFFVIARFVTPAEFGIVVGAVLLIDFFRGVVVEAVAAALMAQAEPGEADYNACFLILLGVTGVAALLVAGGAGVIARLVPLPGLGQVLPAVALMLVATGLCRTHEVWLSRHMQFRALTIRSIGSVALGGVTGAVLAVYGYGVWALVAQQLVASLVAAVLLWVVTPWRPGLSTTRIALGELLKPARHLVAMNFTNFLYSQSDTAVTAAYLGPAQTGLYGAGKRIGMIVSNILSTPFGRVATPALAGMQDDNARMQRAYLQAIALTATVTAPAFAGIAALSGDMIVTLLGSQWGAAGPILTALAANYFMITIGQYNFSVLLVKGKAHWLAALTAVYAVVNLAVIFAVIGYGAVALAIAISVRGVLLSPLSTTPTLRVLGLRWRDYLVAVCPAILCAIGMTAALAAAHAALGAWTSIGRLVLLIPSGFVIYGTLLMIVRPSALRNLLTVSKEALGRGG